MPDRSSGWRECLGEGHGGQSQLKQGGTWVFQVPPAPGTPLLPQTVPGEGMSTAAAMRRSELSETRGWPRGEQSKKQSVYLNIRLFNHAVSPDALSFAHGSSSAA